jgi:PAX-interacting protein 1
MNLFLGLERARLRYMIRSLGGNYSGHLGRWHTHLIARESGISEKYLKAFEWSIPVVNGLWLSELFLGNIDALKQPLDDRFRRLSGTPTIDHFSFDQSFVHELLLPWSKPIRITNDLLNAAIRSHHEQQNIDDDNDYMKSSYCESITTINDPIPTNNGPLLIMLSGFNAKTLNHYETIIKSLGGKISTLPHYTTHLIMNKFLRTEKLYECLGYVSFILNKKWLDKCQDAKRFLSVEESDWLFDDEVKPPKNLVKQSIDKRIHRKNKPLFTGYTFFLTPSVQPSQITLKSIIFSHGGNVRREFPTIKQLTTYDEQTKIPNCLILTCDIDKLLLKDLHKHNNTDFEIKILSIDFVLESIVQQEILNIDTFVMKV